MTYSPEEIATHKAAICDRIANGESLRQICDGDDMPACSTVFLWLGADEAFSEQYARAREAQADALFDDILGIADDGRNDWMQKTNADGQNMGWVENGEALRRSQLRIDARKWMAGKLRPKKYGDKVQMTGPDGEGPVEVMNISNRERAKAILHTIAKAKSDK